MNDGNTRLSRISTVWTTVRNAHDQANGRLPEAQLDLVERYRGAAYRYLLGALRDPEAAEEVFQDFALRMVCGGFAGADESKGRFRDYLRTALIRMVTDYYRQQRRGKEFAAGEQLEDLAAGDAQTVDAFENSWRDELLHLAWQALRLYEETSGNPYHLTLKLRVDRPDLRSAQLAELVSASKSDQPPLTATATRKIVQRARAMFAELLVYEVSHSIESTDRETIERELVDLELLPYCKDALL